MKEAYGTTQNKVVQPEEGAGEKELIGDFFVRQPMQNRYRARRRRKILAGLVMQVVSLLPFYMKEFVKYQMMQIIRFG